MYSTIAMGSCFAGSAEHEKSTALRKDDSPDVGSPPSRAVGSKCGSDPSQVTVGAMGTPLVLRPHTDIELAWLAAIRSARS
jgi:hypothetical protein